MSLLLAGDIGGTKTLLSLWHSGADRLELLLEERFVSAAWDDLAPMVRHFLAGAGAVAETPPAAACFAVAGPVQGGQAQLTNLPWRLDAEALARGCGLPAVELVNDFAVLIYGLPHLQPGQVAPVRDGRRDPQAPLLVLGAGTGLGVAMGLPSATGLRAIPSEAAHGEFAPRSQQEWELKQWLQADLSLARVSIERVVSGTGLGHVARWLLRCRHPDGDHPLSAHARLWSAADDGPAQSDLPAEVAMAAAAGDRLAADALDLWLGAYGSVCGDLALAALSRGGVWLAGGTAAKLLDGLRSSTFLEPFLNKGRLRSTLEPVPITAVVDPAVGSFSAACRARMLLG
ncbi:MULTISPECIES: glucokinase [unclassified Cyanobium]|uniref:glucokinase n=1 Tax=unclassified Cyanobium TaxID=2627006 RepID=UPI0020CDAB90|nr:MULTISPECIES: glucokinase [unclassified Cyanobium]MCP9858544.1 glucokinase [Cyanobium sp. Cruz-8H5]MCP9865800.1 glucokinase [Cyanobium sp. Cruz-8D1]